MVKTIHNPGKKDGDIIEFIDIDKQFAMFITNLLPNEQNFTLFITTALLSYQVQQGHVCLSLKQFAGKTIYVVCDNQFHWLAQNKEDKNSDDKVALKKIELPKLLSWVNDLNNKKVIQNPGILAPLILDDYCRLYLHRYWENEHFLAKWIISNSKIKNPALTVKEKNIISAFWEKMGNKNNQQAEAVKIAIENKFSVITGGPGTGKTTTVLNVLLILLLRQPDLKIALSAPTGKAATRLEESISKCLKLVVNKKNISAFRDIKYETILAKPKTLHRLLGLGGINSLPKFNENNPLPFDLIVIDEASMVSSSMMTMVVKSSRKGTILILIGDADQLTSVEGGAVFGELCRNISPVKKVTLKYSHRFINSQGIGDLASAVNAGEADKAMNILKNSQLVQVTWKTINNTNELENALRKDIIPDLKANWKSISIDPEKAFCQYKKFCVLTVLKKGFWGSQWINQFIGESVKKCHEFGSAIFYPGQPIIVTKNDYNMGIMNGDIGVICKQNNSEELMVWFETSALIHNKNENSYFMCAPVRLGDFESAYSITTHKSQGSEYEKIYLILPDKDYQLNTKELIYTAITRAKKEVIIWGTEEIFKKAINRRTERDSGLLEKMNI